MSRRPLQALLLGAVALAVVGLASLGAGSVLAADEQSQNPLNDQGSSPNYRSLIRSISPATPGLSLQVLQFSDRLLLRNHTGRTVSIEGYEGEPYARIQANGTVEVNKRSPAYYLNQSFYGNVTVPSFASASAAPQWTVVDRTGQFEWHDHRIHWMSPALPPQVKDRGKRTLIFNWHLPIAVGSQQGTVAGQLFWTPNSSAAPVAAIVVGGAIVVFGLLLVLGVRRRRSPRHALVVDDGRSQETGDGAAAAGRAGEGAAGRDQEAGHREAW